MLPNYCNQKGTEETHDVRQDYNKYYKCRHRSKMNKNIERK